MSNATPPSLTRRTVASTAWAGGGAVTTSVLALATSIVVARALDPQELGLYALVAAVVTLLVAASSLQSGGYYIVVRDATPRVLRVGLMLELCIGVVLWIALAAAVCIYAAATGGWGTAALFVVAGSALMCGPYADLGAKFQRDLRYRLPTLTQVATFVLGAATKIVLVLAGLGVWGLVAGDLALGFTFALVMIIAVPEARVPAFDREIARKQLHFGVPLLATGSLSMLSQRLPDLCVGAFLGARSLGVLYLAERIPGQIYQFGRTLSLALLPAFSRADERQLERGFETTVRLSAFLVGLPLAFAIGLGTPLVTVLYGPSWREAGPILALLLAATAIRFTLWHTGNLLKTRRRVTEITVITAVQVVMLAVGCAIAAKVGTLRDVAIAILCVEALLAVPRIRLARSVIPFSPFRALAAPSIAIALGAAAALGCSLIESDWVAVAAGMLAVSAIFGAIVLLTEPQIRSRLSRSRLDAGRVRVLMVSRYAPPAYSGAGRQALQLGNELAASNVDVTLLCTKAPGAGPPAADPGVRMLRRSAWGHGRLSRTMFTSWVVLHLVLHPRRYDVVHVHGSAFVLRALRAIRALAPPIVFKSTMFGKDDPARIADAYGSRVLDTVDRWVCVSGPIAESAQRAGIAADRIVRLPNAIDLKRFRPRPAEREEIRIREGLPVDRPLWLAVGSAIPRKRFDLLLDAWLVALPPRPALAIVAPLEGASSEVDAGFVDQLRETIARGSLEDSVWLLGRREDVSELLACADGFVLPTAQEGMPNAVLEALACGLPAVVTDFPGADDLRLLGGDLLTVVAPTPAAIAGELSRPRRPGARPTALEALGLERIAERYRAIYAELGAAGVVVRKERATAYA